MAIKRAALGLTSVVTGAALGGIGTIGGDVAIGGGATLAPGSLGVGTLTVNGNLALAGTSLLDYEFGQSNAIGGPLNDHVAVGGDLTLDGTIDVTVSPGGSFDVGLYRVASYGGALIDNGLDLGRYRRAATCACKPPSPTKSISSIPRASHSTSGTGGGAEGRRHAQRRRRRVADRRRQQQLD